MNFDGTYFSWLGGLFFVFNDWMGFFFWVGFGYRLSNLVREMRRELSEFSAMG